MLNVILIDSFIHNKNKNALMKYENIKFHIIQNIDNLYKLNLTEFDAVYSPSQPINVSKFPNIKFIFGPHFSVLPKISDILIIKGKNSIYIQPCDWSVNIWREMIGFSNIKINIKILSLPFGVDTNKYNQISTNRRDRVFLYFKNRNPIELNLILDFLKYKNISVKIFDYSKNIQKKNI